MELRTGAEWGPVKGREIEGGMMSGGVEVAGPDRGVNSGYKVGFMKDPDCS